MRPTLLAVLLLAAGPAQASEAFVQAAEAELARAMTMRLPDQPPPYLVSYELLDGEVVTAEASFGALTAFDEGPYRQARVEVRVGDYALDNGNFEGGFGAQQGVRSRALPQDEDVLAFRRELWLATDEAYKGAAQQLSDKLAAREGVTREVEPDLYRVDPVRTPATPAPGADEARIAEIVTTLSAELRGRGLEDGAAVGRDWQGLRVIVSSEGTRAWLPTGYTVIAVEGIARASDGARLRDARWWIADRPEALPPLHEMQAEVGRMADWLQGLKEAPVEEDYLGPVVFAPAAATELFRQLLAPELAGTPPAEQVSDGFSTPEAPPTARIGRRLLPAGWGAVDDPVEAAEAGRPGGYRVDFEGVPARRVALVEDGVLRDLLMSRVPRKGQAGSTGHGRSLGNDRRVAVPAAVTVTAPRLRAARRLERRGLALARQALQPYVLVVGRLEPPGLAEDFHIAFSGEGPLPGLTRPLEAWRLYADGRTEPVRGLEFVGVDRRVLRDLALAGHGEGPVAVLDAPAGAQRFGIGAVGGLLGSWDVPAVLVTELELHGGGGREPRALPPPDAPPRTAASTGR